MSRKGISQAGPTRVIIVLLVGSGLILHIAFPVSV